MSEGLGWLIGPNELVLLLLPAFGLLLLLLALAAGNGTSRAFKRRLRKVEATARAGTAGTRGVEGAVNVRRSRSDSSIPLLDLMIKRLMPRPQKLKHRLHAAGVSATLGTYSLICLLIGTVTVAALTLWGFPPMAANLLFGIFTAIGLPHLAISFLIARRRKNFIAHFPEAIDLMVRGLKSGMPITASIKNAAEEIADPVGFELMQVVDKVRLGAKLEEALWETARRLDIQEFKFFVVALSIQAETGGNLAETLNNLSDVLRLRRQLKLKIKALSSEAKASAYIIGSLPFVMTVLIYMVNAGYIMTLVDDPRGVFMVCLGLLSFAVGAGVMYKMVKFEI